MKPDLIWGVRNKKSDALRGVYRQCWSLFYTEVSQVREPTLYLRKWQQKQIQVSLLSMTVTCDCLLQLWFSWISWTKNHGVITQPSLCHPPQGLCGWCAPGFHKTPILRLLPVFFASGWTDCGAEPSIDHCWISHCGADVRGCLGLNLIEDLAFAVSYFYMLGFLSGALSLG